MDILKRLGIVLGIISFLTWIPYGVGYLFFFLSNQKNLDNLVLVYAVGFLTSLVLTIVIAFLVNIIIWIITGESADDYYM